MTKEDDYVDINQIRELVRVAEESGVGEIASRGGGQRASPCACLRLAMAAGRCAAAARRGHAHLRPLPLPHRLRPLQPSEPDRPAYVGMPSPRPMVGTFYAAPAPGEPPFVQVGDEVMAANQTLCIVEAMKLMNEIAAEEMGTVREVCVEDAQPVEFGTVLFYIEPHGLHPRPAPETSIMF